MQFVPNAQDVLLHALYCILLCEIIHVGGKWNELSLPVVLKYLTLCSVIKVLVNLLTTL